MPHHLRTRYIMRTARWELWNDRQTYLAVKCLTQIQSQPREGMEWAAIIFPHESIFAVLVPKS
jgi:hypothetical protein